MFQSSPSKRCFIGIIRQLVRRNTTNAASILNDTKKKKFSELTPTEIEAELHENLARLRKSIAKDESENYVVPIFKKSILYADQPAIKDSKGEYTYIQLYISAKRLATQISNICSSASMKNIAYLCANNVLSPLTQWACWISGQVAMPLNMCSSFEMLKNLLQISKASALIVTQEYEKIGYDLTQAVDISLVVIDHSFMASSKTTLFTVPRVLLPTLGTVIVEGTCSNDFYTKANAMLLYTMGTTGQPKGVMISHRNLDEQVKSLTKAWKYDSNDCLLHALPLHHAHGFLNAFMCPLNVGGRVVMLDHFDTKNFWSSMLGINTPVKERVNVIMAVPAVYNLLIGEYEKALAKNTKIIGYISNYCKDNVRLMVSGGAPLPPTIFRRWREITGHNILECYGTTEFGLALSGPYIEDDSQDNLKRLPGFVGLPLPDVRVRLVDSNNKVLINCCGEYANDRWTVKFLDTTGSGKPEEPEDQASTSNDRFSEFLDKYFPIEKEDTKLKLKNVLLKAARTVTLNILNASVKAVSFYNYFKKPVKISEPNEKSRTADESSSKDIKSTSTGIKNPDAKNGSAAIGDKSLERVYIDGIFDSKKSENLLGELQVSGPHIFTSYFGNPEANRNAFCDEFFRTGDLATFQNGFFKILGRNNVDVIEIGTTKISSYDIESVILEHPKIKDVTVVALPNHDTTAPNTESGTVTNSNQALGVVCVLQQETELDLETLNLFCAKSLPKYLLPTKLKIVDELPRSNLIEINRKACLDLFDDVEVKSNENNSHTP